MNKSNIQRSHGGSTGAHPSASCLLQLVGQPSSELIATSLHWSAKRLMRGHACRVPAWQPEGLVFVMTEILNTLDALRHGHINTPKGQCFMVLPATT
jgi:hypothetical protein